MATEVTRTEKYSCLALYDWGGRLDAADWLDLALNFFEGLGVPPNTAVWGAGKKSSRPITIRGLQARLQKEPRLDSVELFFLPSGYQTMMDATVSALLEDTGEAPRGKRTMIFSVPGSLESRTGSLRDLCIKISRLCKVRYGIGYERQKSCGPVYYGLGIVQSSKDCNADPAEEEGIAIWFRERIGSSDSIAKNRHLLGKLRDVYPLNFLSDLHLSAPFDGTTIEKVVKADSKWGDLERLSDELWLWKVPSESLKEVGKRLTHHGLIICNGSS